MKSVENKFWVYVIPSMITVLLGGTFAFVDGIFIGQGTGDIGLTAVNLSAPVAALVTALAAGIGMGGSIVMSNYSGSGKEDGVHKARRITIMLLFITSFIILVAGGLFSKQIVLLLGADGEVFQPAFDYLRIVLTFGIFQMFSSGLSNLVINSGKSVIAMAVMVGALIINIILDGIFVLALNMGTRGAALATVTGQAVSAFIYTFILYKDEKTRSSIKCLKLESEMAIQIVKTGLAPFGVQLAPSIVVMCINYACLWTKGAETLATFAVLNQLILAIQILFTGIGNGLQPIISYCTGSVNQEAINKTFRKAITFMTCIAIVLIIVIRGARFGIPQLFNASGEVSKMVGDVLIYILIMIPLLGFNRVLIPFFFASTRHKEANILTYIDPIVITPICLLVCCIWKGSYGIWIAMLIIQISLSIVGYILLKKSRRCN